MNVFDFQFRREAPRARVYVRFFAFSKASNSPVDRRTRHRTETLFVVDALESKLNSELPQFTNGVKPNGTVKKSTAQTARKSTLFMTCCRNPLIAKNFFVWVKSVGLPVQTARTQNLRRFFQTPAVFGTLYPTASREASSARRRPARGSRERRRGTRPALTRAWSRRILRTARAGP